MLSKRGFTPGIEGPVQVRQRRPRRRFAIGEAVPDLPLFLTADEDETVPLEETYQAAWPDVPRVVASGVGPGTFPPPSGGPTPDFRYVPTPATTSDDFRPRT